MTGETSETTSISESGSVSQDVEMMQDGEQEGGSLIPLPCSGATSLAFMLYRHGESMFLKRLRPELVGKSHYHQLFYKEYTLGSQFDCPYIVRYKDFHDEASDCYLVMEYVNGRLLKDVLADDEAWFDSCDNQLRFVRQFLEALDYLHSHQVVHLDLKPSNIMLTKVNNDVKILDLGYCYSDSFAHSMGRNARFAAPEQTDGSNDVDARTDIYALGRLLELLDGEGKRLHPALRKVMEKALQPAKADRWQTAGDIRDFLEKELMHKRPRRLSLWLGGVACTILAALFLVIGMRHQADDDDAQQNRTFIDDRLCYRILSEKEGTCEVAGPNMQRSDEPGFANVGISSTANFDGRKYKVVGLADSCFRDFSFVTTVHIDEGVRYLRESAFRGDTNLVSVSLPESLDSMGSATFTSCHKLSAIRLPSSLKTIPSCCFNNTGLTCIVIPEGVERICRDAFCDSPELTEVQLPGTLRVVERGVFYRSPKLCQITIPASVEMIGLYAFYECEMLTDVYNLSPVPQRVIDVFDHPERITLHVPAESVDLYRKAECWRDCRVVALSLNEH